MFRRTMVPCLALCQVLGLYGAGSIQAQDAVHSAPQQQDGPTEPRLDDSTIAPVSGADALAASIQAVELRQLVHEVLQRNPEIARARHLAAAADSRVPQVSALPDPVAALSLFVLPVETRAGAQRVSASIQQTLPWFGKLALRQQAALYDAAAARSQIERLRLDALTEARTLAHELAFLDAYESVMLSERSTLVRYENVAQGRYAAGTGLQQGIVRIQAQISRIDVRLLEIGERRWNLKADLNRLRDRPADTPLGTLPSQALDEIDLKPADLRTWARSHRPEVLAAQASLEGASTRLALAEKNLRPDITVGLSYTAVERRDDAAARLSPPDDNGDDILALTGSLRLPVRRQKLQAGIDEARARRWAAEEEKRSVLAGIERDLGDLTSRIPLLFQHLGLLESVLQKQAREALRSAEIAYSTGKLNAIDLLDTEVVLFEVQLAIARTQADVAIARAKLERAVGRSIPTLPPNTESSGGTTP